jgi:hypothetical protein
MQWFMLKLRFILMNEIVNFCYRTSVIACRCFELRERPMLHCGFPEDEARNRHAG